MSEKTLNTYTIIVTPDEEGGFTGQCLEMSGAISEGDTMNELEKNMKEAIQGMLESIQIQHTKEKFITVQV